MITIIIMLIFAGISINMLTGDNSILSKAGEAKKTYEESAFKEQLQMEVLGDYSSKIELNATTLKENIKKNISNSNVTNSELPLIVKNTKTNTAYLIDTDGTVMLYDETAVARIKDKFYATLQLAIDAVPTDNTEKEVILLKDTTENVEVKANQNTLLNLNSKTVTGTTKKDYTIATRGKLIINGNGKITGGKNQSVYATGNANLIINSGTFNSSGDQCVYANGNANLTVNEGEFIGQKKAVAVNDNANLTINGGIFSSVISALGAYGNSNVKINKGIFNSTATASAWDAVIHQGSTGTLTIGNIGDNNNDILINNDNNKKIGGVHQNCRQSTVIINSGTINGYTGVNIDAENTKLYLNGGIITGTGGTQGGGSGWSVNFRDGNLSVIVYLKKNADISLSGRGLTGKSSISYQNYITEVD